MNYELTLLGILSSIIIITTGCNTNGPKKHAIKVQNKYCISVCVKKEFSNFHTRGRSWGTGSSSMTGLSQLGIYETVKKECEDFYKNEQCYKSKSIGADIETIHSYYYGPREVKESK